MHGETAAAIQPTVVAGAAGELEEGVAGARRAVTEPWQLRDRAGLPSDPELDAVVLAGGELAWRAGPVAKLPGLCHGAPGTGYAFLKLYRRTGDERWLDRARRFAMHAIGQSERALEADGRRKYSLWTGDLGLTVFLWDCVRAGSEFPTLDVF